MAIAAISLLMALSSLPVVLLAESGGAVAAGTPHLTTVSYTASADRFSLSYLESLPRSWDTIHSFPLVVYLHGMGPSTSWVKGGVGGSSVPMPIVVSAYSVGAILISLNTRSDAGFYVDTACGGPQGRDLLDAIAHEQSARQVSSVYVVGFSMGTIGALAFAATHPSLIEGIALAAPISDVFEQAAYQRGIPQLTSDLCGKVPSPTANPGAVQTYQYLSPLRFHPENFSQVRIYVTAGGRDTRAPNNFGMWPYAQVNSTIVNATTIQARAYGEPTPAGTTLLLLHRASPSSYQFRYVYEALAGHSPAQLNADDMFSFLLGSGQTGFYTAGFPPSKILPVV
jgi:pimeloyl-ACP methyl ester carboxylesterase